ncbi:uncharacterized protein [Drosophila bipectinata]|uniref:uncharacterized protein n=1 Tax=Drosophila bipectinata TaxID=42026 RepID=UPI001C890975|nr:uncharacterized protein LOC108131520 [Drosophila bipectinata]
MDEVYIIAMMVSLFCHMNNLFYNLTEGTMESIVFIFLTVLALKKIFSQDVDYNPNVLEKIAQVLILCIVVQVLLVVAWFPLSVTVHYLVKMACHYWLWGRGWMFKRVKDNAASLILVALELVALFRGFEIDDMQRLFGSKDDLISRSVIAIVEEQKKRVWKRMKRNSRNGRSTIRSKIRDNHILGEIESR